MVVRCSYVLTAYHSHYPKYFANQQAMFEAIVAQVRKITAQTCIDIVIPSGTSLQNLRTSSLNRDNGMDLTRDSYHICLLYTSPSPRD